jgi:CheY-like chemotaxis protein
VFLPASEARAGAPVERPSDLRSLVGTETVLVVEDEAIIRSLVVRTLREQGYEVVEARYGSEALERWEERRDDVGLLVSDVVMPGMSGVELAKRLAGDRPELRILLMSGFADPLAGEPLSAPSGSAFLEKPFTPSELLRRVRETLS